MKYILIFTGILLSGMINSQNLVIQKTNGTIEIIPVSIIDSIYYTASVVPTLTTTAISSISQNSAISGGNITNDGGYLITTRGVCWGTAINPDITGNNTNDGSGAGSFTSNIIGLTTNTLYYVRAYATNSAGTSYGNQISFSTIAPITLGDNYGGGIVFYLDGTGQHGLVCTDFDVSTGITWSNGSYIFANAIGTSIGTGQANTTTIVSVQGAGSYAAQLCNDLSLNGYSDWFLPSKDELYLMYTNLKLNGFGGFSNNDYWSSSEWGTPDAAWEVTFSNGYQGLGDKASPYNYVRAVRAF